MSFTNATPIVVPTGAKNPVIGTNPISCAAPALNNDCFVLDMATSTVAKGKVEVAERKNETFPEGWAIDSVGQPLKRMQEFHALLALGSDKASSTYKLNNLKHFF